MKKAILILAALLMVLSGVAAVSAYEAHVINVTAHVENAMELHGVGDGPHYKMEFGTVFPEEWLTDNFTISMSESFCAQEAHDGFDFDIWVLPKPKPGSSDNYSWLGDSLYLGLYEAGFKQWPEDAGGHLIHVGYAFPPTDPVVSGNLSKLGGRRNQVVIVGLDVPVFEGYYNPYTDPEPKPSKRDDPTVIILKGSDRYPANIDDGITLGAEIKVQITKIHRLAWTPYPAP